MHPDAIPRCRVSTPTCRFSAAHEPLIEARGLGQPSSVSMFIAGL
jgi:hypothetical protein